MISKKRNLFFILVKKLFKKLEFYIDSLKILLSPRQFIYLACILVGISSALAVIVLKTFAHWVYIFANFIDDKLQLPYVNSIFPIIGIVITVFVVKQFLNGSLEKGTSHIMYAVAKKRGVMPVKQMYSQIITSAFTVGMGGSAGLESPITLTGAAFGSNFAQNYKLSSKDRILLLACGVSAGISAAFNAPIAGVLFAVEVILAEITITAFIPIMISAAAGALVSTIVLNENILLNFKQGEVFDYYNIPFYILLGILSGGFCIYYARLFRFIESFFKKLEWGVYKKALFGAFFLSVLIFLFPTLFGEGYESIKTLANAHPENILTNSIVSNYKDNSWIVLLFVGATLLLKVIATGLTLGSGGNGGNFAPSLFVGSYLGFFVAKFYNLLGFEHPLPVSNFTLVGMAGILSGLFHAPLTAIFLIAEITGGYNLMIPLMIVSSVSFAISKKFEPFSFDIKHLVDKGDAYTNDKDKNILNHLETGDFVTVDYHKIYESTDLTAFLDIVIKTDETIFPVFNLQNEFVGLIDCNTVRPILFSSFNVKFTSTKEITKAPKEIIDIKDSIEVVLQKFETTQTIILPVFKNELFVGLIYKSMILERYRAQLKEMIIA